MSYNKLDGGITESTIWYAPDPVRITWITMLAMCDQHGYVGASVPGLAGRARVSVEDCLTALACFMAPDEFSRTKDHEGRRIVEADGGWVLLNHAKYRAKQSEEDRRERARVAMADMRANRRQQKLTVSSGEELLAELAHADADTDTSKQDQKKKQPQAALPECPEWLDPDAWQGFVAMRVKERHPLTARAATLILKKLATLPDPAGSLDQSTRNGWRDVFTIKAEWDSNRGNGHAASGKTSAVDRVRAHAIQGERADADRAASSANGHADVVGSHD